MPTVYLSRRARLALAALEGALADAVREALNDLRHGIASGRRLRGRLEGLWSLRIGSYRVIYERREDGTLRVLAIRHRAAAYRTDPRW